MTIENRYWNDRLTKLERCAHKAPYQTYMFAKNVAEVIDELSNQLLRECRSHDLRGANNDKLREVEAAIYRYIVESNPALESDFFVSEGFGEHVDGPAGERVLAQAARDRDALSMLSMDELAKTATPWNESFAVLPIGGK